jgi:hypothetical protein
MLSPDTTIEKTPAEVLVLSYVVGMLTTGGLPYASHSLVCAAYPPSLSLQSPAETIVGAVRGPETWSIGGS